jgi:hypothetical protein
VDFEAIKLPLAIFLVGLVIIFTVWVFYKMLMRNNAASGRRVAGQVYLLVRAVAALLVISVMVGVVMWLTGNYK